MSDRAASNSSCATESPAFGLAWACAVLSASMVVAWLVVAFVTTRIAGHSTWEIGALAAGICWIGATLSLVVLHLMRVRGSPVAGVLLGMLIRMTIPLVMVVMATMQGSELAQAGLVGQLVVFYLITLAIETGLSVALVKSAPQAASTRSAASEGSASHV